MRQRIKGFMLAETMLGLIVTAFAVMIMQTLLFQLKISVHNNFRDDQLAYAYVQLERFLKDEKQGKVYLSPEESTERQSVFYKVELKQKRKARQKYLLQQYKNMVRVTTPESGHMPLILQIEKARFATGKNYLQINLKGQDGRRSELRFRVEGEKKTDDKEKNKG